MIETILNQEFSLIPYADTYNSLSSGVPDNIVYIYSKHPYDQSMKDIEINTKKYTPKITQLAESGILESLRLRVEDALYLFALADVPVQVRINGMIKDGQVPGEYIMRTLTALRKLPVYRGNVHIISSLVLDDDLHDALSTEGNRLVSYGFLLGVSEELAKKDHINSLKCDIEVIGDHSARSLAIFGLRALVFEPDTYFVVESFERVGPAAGQVGECLKVKVRVNHIGFTLEKETAILTDARPSKLRFKPLTSYGPVNLGEEKHDIYKEALERRGLVSCVMNPDAWWRSCIEYNNMYYKQKSSSEIMSISLLDWHLEHYARWAAAPNAEPEMFDIDEKYTSEWGESHVCTVQGPIAIKNGNNIDTEYVVGASELDKNIATSWVINVVSPSNSTRGFAVGVGRRNHPENGWFLSLDDLTLYSGPPHSYKGYKFGPESMLAKDRSTVTVMFKNGALAFCINGKPLGIAYDGIPLEEPLFPVAGFRFFEDRITISPNVSGFMDKIWDFFTGPSLNSTERLVYAHESEYCDKLVPGAEFVFKEHTFTNNVQERVGHKIESGSDAMWAVFLHEDSENAVQGKHSVKGRIRDVTRLVSEVPANRYSVAKDLPFYIVKIDVIAEL